MSGELAIALAAALILAAVAAAVIAVRTRRVVATPTERAVHAALHTASLAARALRRGLDTESAQTAAPYLRGLTGTDGVALFDGDGRLLAQDPPDESLAEPDACQRAALESISGQRRVLTHGQTSQVIAQPLLEEGGDMLGVLVVVTTRSPAPGTLGAVGEVARYAASQIELAELDASRARILANGQNIAFLVALAFAVAAAANLQTILYSLYWPRFNTRGALWSMYGGLISTIVLIVFSPAVSGAKTAMLPSLDFAWFPLANPGIVSIPLAFILGIVGTLTSPDRGDPEINAEFEVRALTGVGAEKAVAAH